MGSDDINDFAKPSPTSRDKKDLDKEIRSMLKDMSPENVKNQLIKKGYDEVTIEDKLQGFHKKIKSTRKKNADIILSKDFFDRIGYGFASPLLMYLLLYTINAPLMLLGIVAAAKSTLTLFTSSIIKRYNKRHNINKKFIATFGTLFGLTFLLMAAAISLELPIVFAIGILISSVFLVIHGELYSDYVINKLSRTRSTTKSKIVSYFGLIITAIAFVIAGYTLGFSNISINLGIIKFSLPGYLLELEVVAFAFILSSYAFSFVKPDIKRVYSRMQSKGMFFKNYFHDLKIHVNKFLKNKEIKSIFYGVLFSGSFQTVMSTFSCIYIFETIKDSVANPFLHIVIIFGIGIIAASIAPSIAKSFTKVFGQTPMLIFGVFLLAIFPLSIYLNVNYYALIIAHSVSVIGAAVISIVQSFILNRTLDEEDKKTYFAAISPMIGFIMPIIILSLTGIIYLFGFKELFLIVALLNIIVVAPFYFVLVLRAHKKHVAYNSRRVKDF